MAYVDPNTIIYAAKALYSNSKNHCPVSEAVRGVALHKINLVSFIVYECAYCCSHWGLCL